MKYGNHLTLGHIGGDLSRPITMTPDERAMHLYLAGSTGTGKSKQLESCVRQDILASLHVVINPLVYWIP